MLSMQLICMPPLLLSIVAIVLPKRLDVSLFSKLYLSKLKTIVEQVVPASLWQPLMQMQQLLVTGGFAHASIVVTVVAPSLHAASSMTYRRFRTLKTTRVCVRGGRTAACARTSTPAASPPKRCPPCCSPSLPVCQTSTARTRFQHTAQPRPRCRHPCESPQVPCEESPLPDLSADLFRSNHVVYLESLVSPESGLFCVRMRLRFPLF